LLAVDDRLRPLWDFDDLDGTERRLRAQLDGETTGPARAEVLTQLARVEGLRGDFDRGNQIIEDATELAGADDVARARVDLELGRLLRSSGDEDSARPLFEMAYAGALTVKQYFLAADAAHMAALAAADRDGFLDWTNRGIGLAEAHEAAAYWAGPLLNNLGWELFEAGELESALDAFTRALSANEDEPGTGRALALYAVGKTLRGLGRVDEAIPLLEEAVASATRDDRPDGWFHEELAEEYASVDRMDEARVHAGLAIPLLDSDDPSFSADPARRARLMTLADS
jgi:tetratricopeptide (TPR) repeat protein